MRRSDARRNRERLLEAADQVLAGQGVDAQMTDIAKAAGVGIGTLYRNFPSKVDLVNAVVVRRLAQVAERAEEAAGHDDAWEAFVGLVCASVERQLENRMESQLVGGLITGSEEVRAQRETTSALVDTVVERAQAAGGLRPDVDRADIETMMLAVAHLGSSRSPAARGLVLRHVMILLDGLRAGQRVAQRDGVTRGAIP